MPLVRVQVRQKGVLGYINCQRGTWLGNPFPKNKYPGEKNLEMYRKYLNWRLENDDTLFDYLLELGRKAQTKTIKLGCGCKLEARCHVDYLIETIYTVLKLSSGFQHYFRECIYCKAITPHTKGAIKKVLTLGGVSYVQLYNCVKCKEKRQKEDESKNK